jgi:O-antigen ligase
VFEVRRLKHALSSSSPVQAAALGLAAGVAAIAAGPSAPWVAAAVCLAGIAIWLCASPNRWLVVFLAATLVLPPLPLPLGDSGVHPALLAAAAGLWVGMVRLGEWRIRFSLLSLSLLALLAALALSVPAAALLSGPAIAAGSAARIGLLALSAFTFFYIAHGPGRDIPAQLLVRTVFYAGLVSALFAAVDFYFQFPAPARFAEQHVWLSDGVYRRAQGTFYEASTLATMCILMLALTASAGLERTSRSLGIGRWPVAMGAALFLVVLVLSFSRTAVAALAVVMAVLAVRAAMRASPLRLLRAAAVGAFCLTGALGLAAWLLPAYARAFAMRLGQSAEFFLTEPNFVLSRRMETWRLLIDYLTEHPERLLWGIGYKTLPYTAHLGGPAIADNMFLSLLIETGWLGLAALLILSASILLHGFRQARAAASPLLRACGAAVLAFWAGFMIQMLSGDVLTYWRILPAVFALLAIGQRDEDSISRPV